MIIIRYILSCICGGSEKSRLFVLRWRRGLFGGLSSLFGRSLLGDFLRWFLGGCFLGVFLGVAFLAAGFFLGVFFFSFFSAAFLAGFFFLAASLDFFSAAVFFFFSFSALALAAVFSFSAARLVFSFSFFAFCAASSLAAFAFNLNEPDAPLPLACTSLPWVTPFFSALLMKGSWRSMSTL